MRSAICGAIGVAAAVAIVGAAVFVGGVRVGAAPDLVSNGNFDADSSGWTAAAADTVVGWNAGEDGDLDPGSGAASVVWSGAGAGNGVASQCIDISAAGAGNYRLAASYKQVGGGSGGQIASVDVTVYGDDACSADATPHPSGTLVANAGWQSFSGIINFITTEQSMKIELIVHGAAQNDGVYFDKVALSNGLLDTPTPTGSPPATATPTNTPTATPTIGPADMDGDGVPDAGDNCPLTPNAEQTNTDAGNAAAHQAGADALGDACDADIDGDGYANADDPAPTVYCAIMRADVDGDGSVSIFDLATASQYFLETVTPVTERYNQDGDTAISILDLASMSNAFLLRAIANCPAAPPSAG